MTRCADSPPTTASPADDLERSFRRNVARVLATLEQRDRLPDGIEEDERASGQRRALQGVPADDVVEAYRAVDSSSLSVRVAVEQQSELGE